MCIKKQEDRKTSSVFPPLGWPWANCYPAVIGSLMCSKCSLFHCKFTIQPLGSIQQGLDHISRRFSYLKWVLYIYIYHWLALWNQVETFFYLHNLNLTLNLPHQKTIKRKQQLWEHKNSVLFSHISIAPLLRSLCIVAWRLYNVAERNPAIYYE